MTARTDAVEPVVRAALDRLAGQAGGLGIALSGGGDSMALMHLAHGWAAGGRRLLAATVDHGLRAGSDAEARQAGRAAQALGIPHEILIWRREGGGNLMAAARDARLRLLADWARRGGLDAVLLGHTLDDQAETVLMRLNRGAGVDGLSGMSPARKAMGLHWLRPMLEVGRADLRQWLLARNIAWAEDPSNENEDFQRIRTRNAIAALGLAPAQLSQTAANLAMARDALRSYAALAAEGAESTLGSLRLRLAAFLDAPMEIRRRLLVAGLRFVSGADYPPRRDAVLHALDIVMAGGRLTLDGVILAQRGAFLTMIREPAMAARSTAAADDLGRASWDGRWYLQGLQPGQSVRALGYQPLSVLDWRRAGLARDEAAASPGIWSGGELVAAPVLDAACGISAAPLRGLDEFRVLLDTH